MEQREKIKNKSYDSFTQKERHEELSIYTLDRNSI